MNHAKIIEVNAAIERGEMKDGHWFCGGCQRITLVNSDGVLAACVICGRSGMLHRHEADEPLTPASGKIVVRGRVKNWKMKFDAMRSAVDRAPEPMEREA